MLLRNMDTAHGLCNGTRLRVDHFFPQMFQTVVSQGAFYGQQHYLPRIALYPSQSRLPFQLKRLQFPVRLAFALTFNKAQGQTLDYVGLCLPRQLFAHGHLYVALSSMRTGPEGIVYCDFLYSYQCRLHRGFPTRSLYSISFLFMLVVNTGLMALA